jgi:hypothetical protein
MVKEEDKGRGYGAPLNKTGECPFFVKKSYLKCVAA